MRSRGLAVALILILIAACAGGFAAWRVARSRLTGTSGTWEPPTVPVPESTSTSATSIASTNTRVVEAEPSTASTPETVAPTAKPVPSTPVPTLDASPVVTATIPEAVVSTSQPTKTVAKPTATRPLDTSYGYTLRRPISHTKDGCPGKYILGMVTDRAGTPIAGVRIRAVDPWGNEAVTYTKSASGELGRYDIPLYPPEGVAVTYSVQVVDEHGSPMSPKVNVAHGSGANSDATCHSLDWLKVK